MKTKLFLLFSVLWILIGCSDSTSETTSLQISPSGSTQIGPEGGSVDLSIACNSTWKAVCNQNWCIPNQTSGNNDCDLTLTIHPNNTSKERKASVTILAPKANATFHIIQTAQSGNKITSDKQHYQIPVIFHVLYSNPNDKYQYINKGRLSEIIQACNLAYKNKKYQNDQFNTSQDMNLEFVMARKKPDGSILEEVGVERIKWQTIPMSCNHFMGGEPYTDKNQARRYAQMLWNPKVYINIFVYPFTEKEILGISHLPYVISSQPLEGLGSGDYYLDHNVEYPHCISLNSTYIYNNSTNEIYNTTDVYNTLTHELGHYLGLLHVFSEEHGDTDLCKDTDYCTDTPTYNHAEYTRFLESITNYNQYSFETLCKRSNCEGNSFTARNYMDYAFCHSDEFTPQQRKRIRHVLYYGTLTPGPKKYTSQQTRTLKCNQCPPIQVIK